MAARGALLCLLGALPAQALDPARAPTQYVRRVFTAEQGLPQNSVTALAQTTDGYLWLGTLEGLVRFDGVRFTTFDRRNTEELRSDSVTALLADRDGGLWMGLRGAGLVRVKDGRFRTYSTRDGLTDDRVRTLHQDPDGTLWIGTSGGGLNRFRRGRFDAITTRQGLPSDLVLSIRRDRSGRLWVGTFAGLARLEGDQVTALTTRDGLADDRVSSLAEDAQGRLWIGSFGGGVTRLEGDRFTRQPGLPSDQVWALHADRDGSVWIATEGGLARWHDGRLAILGEKDGLPVAQVVSLLEDREGSLWAGTWAGLLQLSNGKFTPISTQEGLPSKAVRTVRQDRHGDLWIGTDGGGLSRWRDGRLTTLTRADGLVDDHVVALGEDGAGSLWIGTFGGGASRLRGGQIQSFGRRQGLPDDVVLAFAADRAGDLWFGTDQGGVSRLRGARFDHFTTEQGLPNNRVPAILAARDGRLWLGTSSGVAVLREGRFDRLSPKPGLSNDRVTTLYEDAQGSLWVGTSAGLNRVRDGKVAAFTVRDGLFDDKIFAILEDDGGRLWMSSNRGVFSVRKSDLEAFAARRLARIPSVAYGTADGMRTAECNGESQPAAWRSVDGRLWFATADGVATIDPARIRTNPLPPPVLIERLLVDGRSQAGAAVVVPAGSRAMEVEYTALSFLAPERMRFRHRLQGYDRDWVEAGSDRSARYMNLPPGSYRFQVQASNADGVWNETGAALDLSLEPFFYQTRAAQALGAVGLVLLGAGLQRLRLRRLRARASELERLVAVQTRDLRDANESLRRAQDHLARLAEAAPEKIEDIAAWGTSMADEIGRSIQARRVQVFRADGDRLVPLSAGAGAAPTWEQLDAARGRELATTAGRALVAVTGMTEEMRGALVIEGEVHWGDTERRLVHGLAQHLGSALDLQHLRGQLTTSATRQQELRQRMRERGVRTVTVCPRCGRCDDDAAERCPDDGTLLDTSRLLPRLVADRYRLTSLLGQGGMGSVFAAHDQKLGRDVALKVILAETLTDPEARFRLEREARTLARIQHPSVAALYDSGELEDGSAFLVMELLSGRDLADLIEEWGPGTPAQVGALLRQLGSALQTTHLAGIIHRDVKPANIFALMEPGGLRFKLLDFGLARSVRADERLTKTGMLVGTPAYMAPEQVEGAALDARTDVYSLAVVAFEAVTGRRLVNGSEVGRMLVDVLYANPPLPSSIRPALPPEVDRLFADALAKRPDGRPAAIGPWCDALARSLAAVTVEQPGWPREVGSRQRAAGRNPDLPSDAPP